MMTIVECAVLNCTVVCSLWRIHEPHQGDPKTAVAAKLIQVAQRELSRPENQQKIKDGLRKLQEATRSRR